MVAGRQQDSRAEGASDERTGSSSDAAPFSSGQAAAAILVGLGFLGLTALGVRYIELVTGRFITTGVPPVPAVAALLLLLGLRALAARFPHRMRSWLPVDRRQILIVFAMVCLGVGVNGQYMVRAFLPHLVTLQYWQAHGHPALARWAALLPSWYAPTDAEAIRRYFEGSASGRVPWGFWAAPLLRWSLFFIALYVVVASLMAIVRRQWIQHERLSFPLLYLPLCLTAPDGGKALGTGPLFRNPLLWSGVGIAALYNGLNIGHALHPAVPAPGFYYAFTGQFPNQPWTPLNSVMLFFMLEAIGFGYFLPLEVSFSSWFFYLGEKLFAIAGLAAGYEAPGFPYLQDQSAGAYLGATALLLYGARRHLWAVARRAFGFGSGSSSFSAGDRREERAAVFLFLGGSVFLLGWVWVSGFSLLVAGPFFLVLLCFVLVYARIRAETGAPFSFVYPYGAPKEMVVNAFTPRGILDLGSPKTWLIFSSLAWLSRHHYAEESAAYTIDAMKLAEESRTARRWFYAALGIAVVAGLALAYWSHLAAFYSVGANSAGGGQIEYRHLVALQEEYLPMAARAATATPRNDARVVAQAAGALMAVALGAARMRFVRSPFHPLGYILATAYGDHTTLFFPMLVAWACKSATIRAGGLVLYRRFIPFFLGLIVGHYFFGGIAWPAISLLLAPEASQSYHVYFGG